MVEDFVGSSFGSRLAEAFEVASSHWKVVDYVLKVR